MVEADEDVLLGACEAYEKGESQKEAPGHDPKTCFLVSHLGHS